MNDYSRHEYLRALLNQKKQLNANSNSLVNPATPQADNIGELAMLNTSLSGTSSSTAPEQPNTEQSDRNWLQRTFDTAQEFVSNIEEGILGFVDGVIDAGGYLYGAISGDYSGAQEFMNYDWEAQALNVLNQMDIGSNLWTGDFFTEGYWQDWADTLSAEASRENINQLHANSWTSEMGAEGQQIYNQITQGIGSALPSIALAILTGGASAGVQAAVTMGTAAISGFGSGASEALNDDASYGEAAIYGGISALIEAGTEVLGGAVEGVKIGAKGASKALQEASQEGFKKIAKATVKNMLSEGLEETVSTLANPLAKTTYKGKEALKEYGTPDLYIEAAISFASGAIGGGVGGEIQRASLISQYGKDGVQALESLNSATELEKEYAEKVIKGGNVETLSQEYGLEYSNKIKQAVETIEQMQQTSPEHYNNLMKAITKVKGKNFATEQYNQMFEQELKPRADETITQRYAKDIGSRIGVDINLVEDSMLQSAEAFMKATGIQLNQEQIQQFNDPSSIQKGLTVDGKVYISNKYQNDINQLIMHEAVSHGYLDSNQELRDGFLNSLRTNKEFRNKLNKISDEVFEAYGLNKTEVTNFLNPTAQIKETMNSETVAKFMEFLYSNNDISSVLNTLNKSKLSSMLSRAIKYLGTKGDATKQARLQLEKILSKIKSDIKKTTKTNTKTNNNNKVKYSKEKKTGYNKTKGDTYDNEFRRIQKTSRAMSTEEIQLYRSGRKTLDEGLRERLSNSVKRILMESESNGTSNANGVLKLTAKGNTFNIHQNVDSKLFRDVFEIARNYLRFGELVDLHPLESDEWNTGYKDCTCYLSEDGLSGFAITNKGDLISVFNASGKSGFLRAIAPVVKENALTLDCFASINQDLETIYESIFNFTTASIMDYNMKYDHDDIAKNHQMPQVAFMVNANKVAGVELQHFNKDQYDEAQEHQLSYTKNIKFSKVKASTTSTTQQTTNTPIKVKSTVYSDFFNQDGTINADWVKKGARGNYGNMIDLKDSKFIIDVALDVISRNLGGANVNIDAINVAARQFFEQYNVSDGEILRSKAYETLLEKLLNADITVKFVKDTTTNEMGKYTVKLNSVIDLFGGEKQFKADMTALINDMIKHYGTPTKLQVAYNKFNTKIQQVTQQVMERAHIIAENARLTYETALLNKKINDMYDEHKIKTYVGVKIPELIPIRNIIKKVNPNGQLKTLSSTSIDHIVEQFDLLDYKPDSEILDKLGITFNLDWFNMYQYFRNKQNTVKVLNKNTKQTVEKRVFPKRALTLDETQMLNSFMKDMAKLLKSVKEEHEFKIRESLSKGTTELKLTLSTIDPNRKTNLFAREIDINSSPDVRLRRIYGSNSDVVKICYDDLLSSHVAAKGVAQAFINDYHDMVKKHKVKRLLSKKTDFVYEGITYHIENSILLDIYLHSLATENKKVLLKSGYEFKYNNRDTPLSFTEESLLKLKNSLPEELRTFGEELLEYYNTTLKDYARKKGIAVLENQVYYPLARNDVANNEVQTIAQDFRTINPDTLPINQQRSNNGTKKLQGMAIDERLASYSMQVSRIGEMSEALDRYNKFLNTKVSDPKNSKVKISRNQLMKRVDSEWEYWKKYIEYQMLGIPIDGAKLPAKLKNVFGNLVSSTLGWNISTMLKQTASIPTVMMEVHFSSWLKGFAGLKNIKNYNKIKKLLMESSPLLNSRFSTNDVTKSHLLTNQLTIFSEFFMQPIEKIDEAIILTFCYQTAMYEAELEGHGKPGTDTNHKAAIKILERIVMNTQSNSVELRMSMSRSGYGGTLRKFLSYFTSDLNNIVNIISETVTYRATANKKIETAEKQVTKLETELAETTTRINDEIANTTDIKKQKKLQEELNNETERIKVELKNLKSIIETNKHYSSGKDQTKKILKLLTMLLMKGLILSGVTQLVDRLYGRKGWNEDTTGEFFQDLVLESTVYNMPYMQSLLNSAEYDQQIGSFEMTGINESLSIINDIKKQIEGGNYKPQTTIMNLINLVGQFTGIPFKNMYNLVFGVWKNIDESGYSVDGYLKGYSDNYILQQYKESVSVGRTNQANGYFEILMKNNKVSTYSTKVQNEIISLTKDGYNCLPKNYMLGYTDEKGNQIKLTEEQIQMFRTTYNNSNLAVEGLLEISEYKSSTQEEKAKLVKKIYDTYYAYARAKTLNQPKAENKLASLLLYTNGKVNIGKYVNVLNTISSIKESKTKSRKELVIEYVNKLRGYSKQEKLLILHLAGYKTNETNENLLKLHLRKNGMNIKDVNQFLGVE